jgi:hypothetical protein
MLVKKTISLFVGVFTFLIMLVSCDSKQSNDSLPADKAQILSLEQKWLTAEFALDTTYLSSIIDTGFIDISDEGIHTKSEALLGMYTNISQRIKDSILIDSFRIEDPVVNLYQNSAVATFIVHTFRRDKGLRNEHKTRFYDVWIKRSEGWKAVSSQGTKIE